MTGDKRTKEQQGHEQKDRAAGTVVMCLHGCYSHSAQALPFHKRSIQALSHAKILPRRAKGLYVEDTARKSNNRHSKIGNGLPSRSLAVLDKTQLDVPPRLYSGVAASALAMLRAKAGAGSRIRTDDLLITNQLLYQLSYAGVYEGKYPVVHLPRTAFYTPFLYGELGRCFGFARRARGVIRIVLALPQRHIGSRLGAATPFVWAMLAR